MKFNTTSWRAFTDNVLYYLFLVAMLSVTLSVNARTFSSFDMQLLNLRSQIRAYGTRTLCDNTPVEDKAGIDCSSRTGDSDETFDSMLLAGYLCYFGEDWACNTVFNSMDEQGGLWRSPQRMAARAGGAYGSANLRMSWDSALGFLLAVVGKAKYDIGTARSKANHWASWLENHPAPGLVGLDAFALCDYGPSGGYDYCALEEGQQRSSLALKVLNRVGAHRPEIYHLWSLNNVFASSTSIDTYFNANSQFGINFLCSSSGDFRCNLAAASAIIANQTGSPSLKNVLDHGFNQNPVALYANNGEQITTPISNLVWNQCFQALQYMKAGTCTFADYFFQRSPTELGPSNIPRPQTSNVWDCITMISMVVPTEYRNIVPIFDEYGTFNTYYNTYLGGINIDSQEFSRFDTYLAVNGYSTATLEAIKNMVIAQARTISLTIEYGGVVSPNTTQTVRVGSKKAFAVTPNANYVRNTTVTGTCPQGSWSGNVWTTGPITANCNVGFSFISTYTVTAATSTNGGTISSTTNIVPHGTTTSFTVTPNPGGWITSTTVGGTCPPGSWNGNVYTTGAITAACAVNFSFYHPSVIAVINSLLLDNETFTVTPTAGANGSISPNTPQLVEENATVAFTVTPNSNYATSTTVGGTCPQGSWSGNVWTTGAIVANCTVDFAFIPLLPVVVTNAVSDITESSVVLNGQVNSNGFTATVNFDFGVTTEYGESISATPSTVYSNTLVAVSANKTGLICNKTYHFRCKAASSAGTSWGLDQEFSTNSCPLCGDSDTNNRVNIVDALAIARYVVNLPPPPAINMYAADVDRDGQVTITDALLIAKRSVGLAITGTCWN